MSTKDTLKAVRELLSEKMRWTQKEYARDKSSKEVSAQSMHACSWCLVGAIGKFSESEEAEQASISALSALVPTAKYTGEHYFELTAVVEFNDSHSHAEVLQLLDKAIDEQ